MDLTCYQEEMQNGLEVFVIPFKHVNSKYATFSTRFNSTIVEFVPEGDTKYRKVPNGVAHFLEHQMFSQQNRPDPMIYYGDRGCDCNANTSKKKTTYLFSGTNNFYENLEFLLDYVQDPAITDKTVEKEKGIIIEELKMYEDRPYSVLYDRMSENLFHVLPYRNPIGGKPEDILKTTKEDLLNCYKTFYHPDNMFLVVTGNVNPEEVFELVRFNQEKKNYQKHKEETRIKKYKEPVTVYKKEETIQMDVQIPKVCIGIKIDISKFTEEEKKKLSYYINFAFWANFGATSEWREQLIQDGIATQGIDFSKERVDDFFYISCSIETSKTEEFLKRFQENLSHLTLQEDALERMKRVLLSDYIFQSDNLYGMNHFIISRYLQDGEIDENYLDKIRKLNQKEFYELMQKINFQHQSIVTIEPIRG